VGYDYHAEKAQPVPAELRQKLERELVG
jgi:hypothetical protein